MIKLTTTLVETRKHNPCNMKDYSPRDSGWNCMVDHLKELNNGNDWPEDKPVNLLMILDSNGVSKVQDFLWALRATIEDPTIFITQFVHEIVKRAIGYAESCLSRFEKVYPADNRPRNVVNLIKKWLVNPNDVSKLELFRANEAAWAAADAAWTVETAAMAAFWAAEAAMAAAEAAEAAVWAVEAAARAKAARAKAARAKAARATAARAAMATLWAVEAARKAARKAVWPLEAARTARTAEDGEQQKQVEIIKKILSI